MVDKPIEWTSFDVVNKIRYALKKSFPKIKVGHAGTLDPLATGLLIICTGKMTKQIDHLQALEKKYTGTFHLGATTPSYDSETAIDANYDTSHIDATLLDQTTLPFIGEIQQIPPIYSALKKDGRALYHSAREGKIVEIAARSVVIHDFKIVSHQLPDIAFEVHCSKGTYIRSLAYDYGKALNSGAYLSSLRRTACGEFTIENAWNLDVLIEFINDTLGHERL
ncbi:MAG: tRNA pseudouridine(55) synthase TruB [Bacteroidota bacterium]